MARKKTSISDNPIYILNKDNEENMEICCFTEAANIVGTPVASFNFNDDAAALNLPVKDNQAPAITTDKTSADIKSAIPDKLIDNRTLQSQPNGITPPVNGEHFEIKRTFIFRRSTLRKLNKLKAAHPDENAYLSSIVDAALQHYYNHIFNEGGSQG